MANMKDIFQGAKEYARKVFDEAVVRGAMDYATKTVEAGAKEGLHKLNVRIFGWGENDERISFQDQAELGQAAVQELTKYMERLNNRDTYRFRIIMSGIPEQSERLKVLRMILDIPTHEERLRQLDQICQKPEYISGAAKWLWERFRKAAKDRDMRNDLRHIMRDIDNAAGEPKGTAWNLFRGYAATAGRAVDTRCASLAEKLHNVNETRRQQQERPTSIGSQLLWLFTGIRRS